MTHAWHIDPNLAAAKCTLVEREIVLMRNATPPMAWSDIAGIVQRTQGECRRIWAEANRKVNGGYVPPTGKLTREERELERLKLMADPDIIAGLKGIPTVGLSKPGAGIVPGKPTRSGK